MKITDRRHPEWFENQVRWRWLMDSLIGGQVYRQAIYGTDSRGLAIRNLIRHKREYPDPVEKQVLAQNGGIVTYVQGLAGTELAAAQVASLIASDQAALATDDDYELRRARTPVPTFVKDSIDFHLGKIIGQEIEREADDEGLKAWWDDCDGRGTCIDEWLAESVAQQFLALGQIDILFDHPPAPDGVEVRSESDVTALGLRGCYARIILPENVIDWRLDEMGRRYTEAVIREFPDPGGNNDPKTRVQYRLVNATEIVLHDSTGKVLSTTKHRFGRCPLIRVFDRRAPRAKYVGMSRYEGIAERQREYYNRDSELILSDTTQAHPLLQGPEDYVQADGGVPIGPSWLLPKKKNLSGTTASYEGFDVIEFPKDGAESLRQNKADIRDDIDRDAGLVKPAGTSGTSGGTVSQSGVSKKLDSDQGNAKLKSISTALQKLELALAEMALCVVHDTPEVKAILDKVKVVYPKVFDLDDVKTVGDGIAAFQDLLERMGEAPETELKLMRRYIRQLLPGRDDATYEKIEKELEEVIAAKAADRKAGREMAAAMNQGDNATPPGMNQGQGQDANASNEGGAGQDGEEPATKPGQTPPNSEADA